MSTSITPVQLAEIETKRAELLSALKPLQDFVRNNRHPEDIETSNRVENITSSEYYPVEPLDKQIARKSPNSPFAVGLGRNPNYPITEEDKAYARQNPHSRFVNKLVVHKNWIVTREDKDAAIENPNTPYAYITLNPSFKLDLRDIEIYLEGIGSKGHTEYEFSLEQHRDFRAMLRRYQEGEREENTVLSSNASIASAQPSQITPADVVDFAESLGELGHMLHGIKRLAGIIKDLP